MRLLLHHGIQSNARPHKITRIHALVICITLLNLILIPQPVVRADNLPQAAEQRTTDSRPAITLAEIERMAIENNPTLAQAEAAVRAAEGRRVQAGLYPDPVIGYSGEELAFRSFANKSEHFFFFEQNIVTAGKLKKSRRIFEQEKAQTQAESEAQRLRVINTVRMLYYQTLGAQQMLDIRAELSRITSEAVRISAELFNIGQADKSDQLEIEIEAQKAEVELINAENDLLNRG